MAGKMQSYMIGVTRQPPGSAAAPERVLRIMFSTTKQFAKYTEVLAYFRHSVPTLLDVGPGSRLRVVSVDRVSGNQLAPMATNGAGDLAVGEWW